MASGEREPSAAEQKTSSQKSDEPKSATTFIRCTFAYREDEIPAKRLRHYSHHALHAGACRIQLDPAGGVHLLQHQGVVHRHVFALEVLPQLAVVHALEAEGHAAQVVAEVVLGDRKSVV